MFIQKWDLICLFLLTTYPVVDKMFISLQRKLKKMEKFCERGENMCNEYIKKHKTK
jgi:hypothetical protein